MNRRRFVMLAGLSTISVAGCTSPSDSPPSTSTPTSSVSPSATSQPRAFLPEPVNGWTRDRTEEFYAKERGGSDGIRGYYTGPDGEAYQVLVLFAGDWADGNARSWRCAGWQVAFAVDGVTFAASTGTAQRTFTPERPPTMTKSPVPGTDARVRELLALSPKLDQSDIPESSECS
jgi:hypothetical protein